MSLIPLAKRDRRKMSKKAEQENAPKGCFVTKRSAKNTFFNGFVTQKTPHEAFFVTAFFVV